VAMRKNIIFLELFLFFLAVGLAVYEKWTARDLVWSLWISSLVLGYSYILTSILGVFLRGDPFMLEESEEKGNRRSFLETQAIAMNIFLLFPLFGIFRFSIVTKMALPFVLLSLLLSIGAILKRTGKGEFFPDSDNTIVRIFILLPSVIFMLGFFSIHFLGFHFIHSIFLNGFFPLIKDSPFGKTPQDVFFLFKSLVIKATYSYWPFIVVSALSRLKTYLAAFNRRGADSMFYPYANVIRMHVMIFIFAFMWMAQLKSFILYIVLVFYFFPLGSLIEDIRRESIFRKSTN
jgi:L-asparagine transporter-like permease